MPLPSKKILGLFFIFLLPFIIRAGYFLDTRDKPYTQEPILLSYVNHQFAIDLMDNTHAPYTIFRSPFYPLFISKIYKLFGTNPFYIKIIQWFLGALGCVLLFFIANHFLSFKKALIVFTVYSLYVPSVYFEGELFEHSLSVFFILLSILLIIFSFKKQTAVFGSCLLIFFAAVFYGLSFLLRPDILLSLPFLIISFIFFSAAKKLKILLMSVFTVIVIIFVYFQVHPLLFMPVSENRTAINASVNFYLGNNPKADGFNPMLHEVREMPSDHPEAIKYHITGLTLAMVLYAKTQTSGGLDTIAAYWLGRAKSFILNHPLKYLFLELKKAVLFFNGFFITNQKDIYYLRNFSAVLSLGLWNFLICFPLGLIFPFALIAIFFQKKQDKKFLLLCFPLGCLANTLIFFQGARFNQPAIPFFIILAVEGFFTAINHIRQKKWGFTLILLGFFILCNFNFFNSHYLRNAQESFNVGRMYLKKENFTQADRFFRKSIKYDNQFAPAILSLNIIFQKVKKQNEGLNFYLDLYKKNKKSWATLYCIADLYSKTDNLTKALMRGKQLIEQFPDNSENYMLLGNIYLLRKEPLEAVSIYQKGSTKFPDNSLMQLSYVSVLVSLQNYGDALKVIEHILSKTTYYPEIFYYAGYCFIAEKQYEDAYAILNAGIQRHPGNFSLLNLLAYVFEQTKQIDKAIICHEQILKSSPENNVSLYETARLLNLKGNRKKALSYAVKAYKTGNPNALELIRKIKK
ncbi:tetratricopeptide repeat protein [bacterium]|nr:tetratricopeptide repeat protein [bacterium]